jgi:hypothetical protein
MGYLEDSTLADKINMDDRHVILGNAMDANCLECFFTICIALSRNLLTQSMPVQFTAPPSPNLIALTATFNEHEHTPFTERWWHDPDHDEVGLGHALAGLEQDDTAAMESHLLTAGNRVEADVWGEPIFLAYLQTNEYPQ